MIFSLWDLGGGIDARSFWRFYYPDTQAIIFVVDSSDVNRMVPALPLQDLVHTHLQPLHPGRIFLASRSAFHTLTTPPPLNHLPTTATVAVGTAAAGPPSTPFPLLPSLLPSLPQSSPPPLLVRMNRRPRVARGLSCSFHCLLLPPLNVFSIASSCLPSHRHVVLLRQHILDPSTQPALT